MAKVKEFFRGVWDKVRYPIQHFLFLILTTGWFTKTKANRIVKLETFYALMSGATLLGTFALFSDTYRDLEYSSFYQWMLVPFWMLLLLRWLGVTFLGTVPKSIQDKYWKTQIMNFTDPKFTFQRSLYPNWRSRLDVLKNMWIEDTGETIEFTRENAPWQQSPYFQISIILICAAIGGLLGHYSNVLLSLF